LSNPNKAKRGYYLEHCESDEENWFGRARMRIVVPWEADQEGLMMMKEANKSQLPDCEPRSLGEVSENDSKDY
jgi:hypothetical protein